MNLFEITKEQQELINQIEILEGEITPEIEELLTINKSELNQKSIAYLEVIKQKDGVNTVIDAEIKRLQALKKRNVNVTTRLKDNLLNAVKLFGDFEVGTQRFATRKSQTIEVEFIGELPNEYLTVKTTTTANKVELKKALKSGIEIEGVTLKDNLNLKIN